MRFLFLLGLLTPCGCSPSKPTAQPEPVPVNRKFFDDTGDPAKQRTVPKALPK